MVERPSLEPAARLSAGVLLATRSVNRGDGTTQATLPGAQRVEMMLLALTTPSGNKSALPSVTRTLPQAELFHRALVGLVGKGTRVYCPELTGRDKHGELLRDHHGHAHTIPLDLDGDGRLDHLLIHAKMRLGDAAQGAIRTLKRTWTKGSAGEIQLAVVGVGDLTMLRQLPGKLGESIARLFGPATGSRIWESVTPYVPPRFLKPRGKNTLLGQISDELASRRLPKIESAYVDASLTRELRHFARRRNHGGVPPPVAAGYGMRLIISEPLSGPLSLGYASHFGLGLFRPVL